MSSSRRGSEESILSMLERDSGRARRWPAGKLALYGAAALLVAGLVGTLALLARDNRGQQQVEPILLTKPTPMVAMTEATPAAGAAIIDSAEPPAPGTRAAPAQPDAAPLVLVQPDESNPVAQPEPAVASAPPTPPEAAPSRAAKASPARAAPRPRTSKPSPAARRQAPVRRPAAARKPGVGGEREGVDTDVALISAIISHAAKRGEDEPHSGQ